MARNLARTDIEPDIAIQMLGQGRQGDEAIAIAVYSVLKYPDDFEKAIVTAVNHDGDSDSTGAIAGSILGAYLGEDKIPDRRKNTVELKKELIETAEDLYKKPKEIENADVKYPAR